MRSCSLLFRIVFARFRDVKHAVYPRKNGFEFPVGRKKAQVFAKCRVYLELERLAHFTGGLRIFAGQVFVLLDKRRYVIQNVKIIGNHRKGGME